MNSLEDILDAGNKTNPFKKTYLSNADLDKFMPNETKRRQTFTKTTCTYKDDTETGIKILTYVQMY